MYFLLTDEYLYSACLWDSSSGFNTPVLVGWLLQATDDFYTLSYTRLIGK